MQTPTPGLFQRQVVASGACRLCSRDPLFCLLQQVAVQGREATPAAGSPGKHAAEVSPPAISIILRHPPSTLGPLAEQSRNNISGLLTVHTLKGSTACRNQLKRIQKMAFTSEQGEEFERAWLLLADIHIQGGKFDLAQASACL